MLVAILILFLFHTGLANEGKYINSWIVQIDGDAKEAERLARKHGFNNKGQVCYNNRLLLVFQLLLFCYLGQRGVKGRPLLNLRITLSYSLKTMFLSGKHFTCIPQNVNQLRENTSKQK